ncbi:protein phosphatase 2C domain-containing protein [Streptosporangium sp. NPDC005286]|uniref:protein phosphatase 2C domain-containing protein n=1 Tax=Streptosporangium sp. NPDC005286 TaxID=3154463 RepID=UPI0033A5ED5C
MRISYETAAAPGRPHNEDYVVTGPRWVAVLDGATAPAGVESGCKHDVPWLVAQLGSALARQLATRSQGSLPDLVSAAIRATMAAHADTCDLTNLDSPSSTVAVLRQQGELVDYLVLCDSPIALQHTDGTLTVIDDDRTDRLPGGRPYSLELVRASRNRPGGFWVAAAVPEAAYEALTGSVEASTVSGALLLTDGVTRLVEWYGHTWEQLVDTAATSGPGKLIRWVRQEERDRGAPSIAKKHDDATAAWLTW